MKKTIFNIQIHLSDQQLKMLCERNGFVNDSEELDSYHKLAKDHPDHVFDDNPHYSNSIGADINDVLSLGFAVMNAMEKSSEIQLTKEDLHYHPFRISYPDFTKVEYKDIPFENTSEYEPMEFAISK